MKSILKGFIIQLSEGIGHKTSPIVIHIKSLRLFRPKPIAQGLQMGLQSTVIIGKGCKVVKDNTTEKINSSLLLLIYSIVTIKYTEKIVIGQKS